MRDVRSRTDGDGQGNQWFVWMARETEPVRKEAARQLATFTRMAASTSVLGYGIQAVVLLGHVSTRFLVYWLLLVALCEVLHWLQARQLGRQVSHPAARHRALRRLAWAMFCAGSGWGCAVLLPGLDSSAPVFMYNIMFLVVVGIFSVQVLCLSWPVLAAFNLGLMWPVLVSNALHWHHLTIPLAMPMTVLGELLMVHLYGRTTRRMLLEGMRARLATEALAAELRQKNDDLTHALSVIAEMADLDPLTQCMNRRALMRHLQEPVRHQRFGACFGIVLLDIDHFKQINDSLGHGVGDQVLVAVADCLRTHLRAQDCLARWGGEEFICLLADVDGATVQAMAERLRWALAGTAILPPPAELRVTASFGLALCRPGYPLDAVIDQADQAMYRAKHGGRNRVEA